MIGTGAIGTTFQVAYDTAGHVVIDAPPLDPYGIVPDAAVEGTADGTDDIVLRATVTTLDGLETAVSYSNAILVERKNGTAPATPTITGPMPAGNLRAIKITDTATVKTWRPGIDLSAYSGGTVQKVEWNGLTAAHANYADPLPQQIEPCVHVGSGVWRETLHPTTQPQTLGLITDQAEPFARRYRVWVGGIPSAWSARVGTSGLDYFVPPTFTGSIETFTGVTRQFRLRRQAQFDRGEGGGQGQQSLNNLSWEGAVLIGTGDYPAPTSSRDNGDNWQGRRQSGYRIKAGLSTHIHPANTLLIHAVGHHMSYANDPLRQLGLYRSTDGGETYALAFSVSPIGGFDDIGPFYMPKLEYHLKWIAHSRVNDNVMWCLIQQRPGTTVGRTIEFDLMQAGLWKSIDRGATWTPRIAFGSMNAGLRRSATPHQAFGHIWQLYTHPTVELGLYLLCESGLYYAADPTSDASFTLIAGGWVSYAHEEASISSGVMANFGCRSLWISNDGHKGIFTIDSGGVYTWNNASHTIVNAALAYDIGPPKLCQVSVNRGNTDHVLLLRGTRTVGTQGTHKDLAPMYSDDFFVTAPDIGDLVYFAGDDDKPFGNNGSHESLNAESGIPASHPTHPTTWIVSSNRFYKTTDGLNFNEWQNGYAGPSFRDISLHPSSASVCFMAVDDTQSYLTQDMGKIVNMQNLSRSSTLGKLHDVAMGGSNFTGLRCLTMTDGSFLIRLGKANGTGQLFRISLDGPNLVYDAPIGLGTKDAPINNSRGALCHDANLVGCYVGSKWSSDRGKAGTYTDLAKPSGVSAAWQHVCGASPVTSGVAWGIDPISRTEFAFYRCTGNGLNANNWTRIATIDDPQSISSPENSGRRYKLWPHPTDAKKCYVHTLNNVYELNSDSIDVPRSLKVDEFTQALPGRTTPLLINCIAVDYVDPHLIYVGLGQCGWPSLLRAVDAHLATPTWTVYNGDSAQATGAIPYQPVTAMDVHRTDRTLVVGQLADGLYAVKPPTAGVLFGFLRDQPVWT